MSADPWSPEQYERFRAEREQPFWDLLPLIDTPSGGRIVDLGCGTGALTRELHRRLRARETIGVDSSQSMLERSGDRRAGLALRSRRHRGVVTAARGRRRVLERSPAVG